MELRLAGKVASVYLRRPIMTGLATLSIWTPGKTEIFNFVHVEQGVSVSISQNSPPRAVLEDELIQPLTMMPEKLLELKAGQMRLVAGVAEKEIKPEIIARDFSRVIARLNARTVAKQKTEASKLAAREVVAEVEVAPAPLAPVEVAPLVLSKSAVAIVAEAKSAERIGATRGEAVPAFGDAFKSSTQVKEKSEKDNEGAASSSSQPEDLLIDTMTAQKPWKFTNGKVATASSHRTGIETKTHEPQEEQPSGPVRDLSKEGPAGTFVATNDRMMKRPTLPAQVVLAGHIELKNGLGIGTGANLEVLHMISGQAMSRGQVSLKKGTYQILIQEPGVGDLVAEVRDQSGMLIGKTEVALDQIDYSNIETGISKRLDLALVPVLNAFEGHVASAYASDSRGEKGSVVTLAGLTLSAETDKQGSFHHSNVLHDSDAVVVSAKPGYWGSIMLSDNSKSIDTKMFPNKMIQALAEILEVDNSYVDYGIVWGRIEDNGKAAEGATVEITDPDAIGPIYFNALQIADKNLEKTTANGLFAFIKVEPGLHMVRAQFAGRTLPTKLAVAQKGHVAPISFEVTDFRKARTVIYDAITGAPLPSQLQFSGSEKSVATQTGVLGLKYFTGQDLMFLEAQAGSDYLPARQIMARNVNFVNFPMVKRAWLDDLANAARINRTPQTGTVVGFVHGTDFEVVLPEGMPAAEILYFDAQGNNVGNKMGPANGGFVIFNADPGLHNIGIMPNGNAGLATKLFFADTEQVSIINYRY